MNKETILKELLFKAVRSSGAGGQHVNKTSSKIVLSFHIHNSNGLEENEKERLLKKRFKISTLQKNNKFTDNRVVIGNGPSLSDMFENSLIFFQNKDLYVVNNFSLSDYFFILKPKFYIIIFCTYCRYINFSII